MAQVDDAGASARSQGPDEGAHGDFIVSHEARLYLDARPIGRKCLKTPFLRAKPHTPHPWFQQNPDLNAGATHSQNVADVGSGAQVVHVDLVPHDTQGGLVLQNTARNIAVAGFHDVDGHFSAQGCPEGLPEIHDSALTNVGRRARHPHLSSSAWIMRVEER